MPDRPYTLLSCSVSIDGYIANASSRLLLSNDTDFDRVDAVRASCDCLRSGLRVQLPRRVPGPYLDEGVSAVARDHPDVSGDDVDGGRYRRGGVEHGHVHLLVYPRTQPVNA